ncbi:protein of unknown function [Nocardia cyriacigeorgica GUH-2]|uniref:Uncharacterized protein n=1 Tax=Nocardia cyriacigeorgica (strain GUH-2) TaxID=1127134 RepID=H6RA85_NOCCG|nr:protein of unknown function [Nocardia cyriacigeorgica GUH-2]
MSDSAYLTSMRGTSTCVFAVNQSEYLAHGNLTATLRLVAVTRTTRGHTEMSWTTRLDREPTSTIVTSGGQAHPAGPGCAG